MIFNIIAGGLISTITVNTAAGASVTCAMSPFSYTATANSSGVATFTVHMKGTWTCTSTKNGITNSGTVSITANGQNQSISLPLRLWIFKSGTGLVTPASYYAANTVYRAITGTSSFDVAYNTSGIKDLVYTDNKINLSNYSKFVVDSTHYDNDHQLWMLANDTDHRATTAATINKFSCPKRTTISYDISSLTGNYYVGLYNGSSWGSTFYNWYLEV